MIAGFACTNITPEGSVVMDGMIREHQSEGVHDPLHARALYLSAEEDPDAGFVVVAVDVCALRTPDARRVREAAAERTGVPAEHIIIAATHTHSGPATYGFFNPVDESYLTVLHSKLVDVIVEACEKARPAAIACGSGIESTISHYRRMLADDGHVVMNWEPFPPERIVQVLGEPDPALGLVIVTERDNPSRRICALFSHAGHPNVMSGENFLLSADYPGFAVSRVEEALGCPAMFVNGAQGSVDIDGLKDRDWEGIERAGGALADAVISLAVDAMPTEKPGVRVKSTKYELAARRISSRELCWAADVLVHTRGRVKSRADGVGDDFKAALYIELDGLWSYPIEIEQTCFAIGDTAFISFPGELFTEIGMRIKAASPFAHTYVIGLANGYIGYAPTRLAITQGGYEPDTRRIGDDSEEIIVERSLALLREVIAT